MALGTPDADVSTEHLGQPLRDRQAEPCTAEFASRRRIRLGERGEQLGLCLRGHSNARVDHLEAEAPAGRFRPIGHLHEDAYTPALRELDRVAREVHQYLSQSGRVDMNAFGDRPLVRDIEGEALVERPRPHQRGHLGHQLNGRTLDALQGHPASLDLG